MFMPPYASYRADKLDVVSWVDKIGRIVASILFCANLQNISRCFQELKSGKVEKAS